MTIATAQVDARLVVHILRTRVALHTAVTFGQGLLASLPPQINAVKFRRNGKRIDASSRWEPFGFLGESEDSECEHSCRHGVREPQAA